MTVQQIAEATFSPQQLKNEDVAIFVDKMNTLMRKLEHRSFLAVEFGWNDKVAGKTLQESLGNYKKLWEKE